MLSHTMGHQKSWAENGCQKLQTNNLFDGLWAMFKSVVRVCAFVHSCTRCAISARQFGTFWQLCSLVALYKCTVAILVSDCRTSIGPIFQLLFSRALCFHSPKFTYEIVMRSHFFLLAGFIFFLSVCLSSEGKMKTFLSGGQRFTSATSAPPSPVCTDPHLLWEATSVFHRGTVARSRELLKILNRTPNSPLAQALRTLPDSPSGSVT